MERDKHQFCGGSDVEIISAASNFELEYAGLLEGGEPRMNTAAPVQADCRQPADDDFFDCTVAYAPSLEMSA